MEKKNKLFYNNIYNLMIKKIRKSKIAYTIFFTVLLNFTSIKVVAKTQIQTDVNFYNEATLNFEYFEQKNFSAKRLIFSSHPLIERFKAQYLTPRGLNYLSKIMQHSVLYRDFILEQLEVHSMPNELLFLPVIESGFNPKAVSRSGAVGIWQFMKNSIGGYNITISKWVDERRDPWKTSIAAIKKLKYNYDILGDWCLALAAYNTGLNGIKRAIKRAGSNDFWYLLENGYLKKETALYVPKFLAISEILMQSSELNIDWGDRETVLTTATVKVKQAIDINLLEKELYLKKGILKFLNPALNYSITPPDHSYDLRIPSEYTTKLESLLSGNRLLVRHYTYEIKSGDTLYALAQHYGVTIQSIQSANYGLNANNLKIGQKIIIPALKNVSPYKNTKTSSGNFTSKYTVKKGDTLWSIAITHNTTVEILADKNNLSTGDILKIGKVLFVP